MFPPCNHLFPEALVPSVRRLPCWSLARYCQETLRLCQLRFRRLVVAWFQLSSGSKTMSRWLLHQGRITLLSQSKWMSSQCSWWVDNALLIISPRLISALLLAVPIVMPCNLALIPICNWNTSWIETLDSHAPETSVPLYSELSGELIRDVLEMLADQLSICRIFLEMLMEDLQLDL